MDEFVRNTLTEWGFSDRIECFKAEHVDEKRLFRLEDKHINQLFPEVEPNAKFRGKLELLKSQQTHEETAESAQVCPSTSGTRDKEKRKLDHQDESITSPPRKRQHGLRPDSEEKGENLLYDLEEVMKYVDANILGQDNKLNEFLKDKISDLETDKKKLIGVFGKTGAGKSSLINAVIGKKNLLTTGDVSACTSVMIKVEANMQSQKYEAHIEFIKNKEWKQELHSCKDNKDLEEDADQVEKLSALYGEEWRNKKPEDLMDGKYFREIPEFLQPNMKKILTCESAEDLSKDCVKYIRSASKDRESYWPLVKCVTVKVPDNKLLQHVTLVDLPGNGDDNKSRDQMWKEVIGSCSTVWIVTEINRAASEKEAWEILERASNLMGNGGECQKIHFICTKSDIIGSDHTDVAVSDRILERNKEVKEAVKEKFKTQNKLKNYFKDDSFEVFTVSSSEFLRNTHLNAEQTGFFCTEIPKLQKFLQHLNEQHSKTKILKYVSGAYGILSLIQGAICSEVAGEKTDVSKDLEENLRRELEKVRTTMEEAYKTFEKCLSEGVENAKKSCETVVTSVIHPPGVSGRGFHKILKCVIMKNGTHKPKNGEPINLNTTLSSLLAESIDEEYQITFPNEENSEPFNGAISTFSLHTEKLIEKYKNVKRRLTFLKTEEYNMKRKLKEIIRERKKTIYNSLTMEIEKAMLEGYQKAAGFKGTGSMEKMRETIVRHVQKSKDTMFEQAKKKMLNQLTGLMVEVLKTLQKSMKKSIELSLKTDDVSTPVLIHLTNQQH